MSHPALSARVMKSVSIGFHRMAAALDAAKAQRLRTRWTTDSTGGFPV
jgi:hypothetical protein